MQAWSHSSGRHKASSVPRNTAGLDTSWLSQASKGMRRTPRTGATWMGKAHHFGAHQGEDRQHVDVAVQLVAQAAVQDREVPPGCRLVGRHHAEAPRHAVLSYAVRNVVRRPCFVRHVGEIAVVPAVGTYAQRIVSRGRRAVTICDIEHTTAHDANGYAESWVARRSEMQLRAAVCPTCNIYLR